MKRATILGLGVVLTAWTAYMLLRMASYALQSEDQHIAVVEAERHVLVVPLLGLSIFAVIGAYVVSLGALGWLWSRATSQGGNPSLQPKQRA